MDIDFSEIYNSVIANLLIVWPFWVAMIVIVFIIKLANHFIVKSKPLKPRGKNTGYKTTDQP